MQAMRLVESAGAPILTEETVQQPEPGPGEFLVRVHAVGITPSEVQWYPTTHSKDGGTRTGAILGHEFSGTIAAAGPDAGGFEIGQEIYGMNDWFADGAMAEYCVTKSSSIAAKPARLSHAEAASVPIGALTAWQGLYDRGKLKPGERVLVHGGAGAVGVFAIQLAHRRGAFVLSTVSARNSDFVSELGADQVIDYHARRFEDMVGQVDLVFDTVGGETLRRSFATLSSRGRVIAIAAEDEKDKDDRVKEAFFIVEPDQKQLVEIGLLLDSGQLQPVVDAIVPFSQASAALAGNVGHRRGRGKIVVTMA